MPFALLFIGILAFVSAYRDTLPSLGTLLKGDFSGAGNFLYWVVVLVIIGSLGNFAMFRSSSKMLLLLVLVVMAISDKGFFAQFIAALNAPAPASSSATAAEGAGAAAAPAGSGSGGVAGTGVSLGQVGQALAVVGIV